MKAARKWGIKEPHTATSRISLLVSHRSSFPNLLNPRHIIPAVGGSRIRGTAGKERRGKGEKKKKKSEFSISPILKQSANSGISPWQGHVRRIYSPSPEGHSSHGSPEPEGLGAKDSGR